MSHRPAIRARAALLRALAPHLGPHALLGKTSRDWASALFVGARHRLAIALEGADALVRAERLVRALGEAELVMQGGFVADLAVMTRVEGAEPVLAIEALTIEEAEEISCAARRAG